MTLRQPHEDALLPAADVAMIRQVLGACADLIQWAEANYGTQFARASGDVAEAAGFSRAPGALAGQACLAGQPDFPMAVDKSSIKHQFSLCNM